MKTTQDKKRELKQMLEGKFSLPRKCIVVIQDEINENLYRDTQGKIYTRQDLDNLEQTYFPREVFLITIVRASKEGTIKNRATGSNRINFNEAC